MTLGRMLSVGWNKPFLTDRDWGIRWRGRRYEDAIFFFLKKFGDIRKVIVKLDVASRQIFGEREMLLFEGEAIGE